jgi:hypothetical protein
VLHRTVVDTSPVPAPEPRRRGLAKPSAVITARHEGRSPRLLPNRRMRREKQSLHSLAIPWPTPPRVVHAASDNDGPCVITALFRSQ